MWGWIKANKWRVLGLLAIGFFFGGFIFGIPLLLIRKAKNVLLGSGSVVNSESAGSVAEAATK